MFHFILQTFILHPGQPKAGRGVLYFFRNLFTFCIMHAAGRRLGTAKGSDQIGPGRVRSIFSLFE